MLPNAECLYLELFNSLKGSKSSLNAGDGNAIQSVGTRQCAINRQPQKPTVLPIRPPLCGDSNQIGLLSKPTSWSKMGGCAIGAGQPPCDPAAQYVEDRIDHPRIAKRGGVPSPSLAGDKPRSRAIPRPSDLSDSIAPLYCPRVAGFHMTSFK